MAKNIYLKTAGIEILDGDNFVSLKGILKNADINDWLKIIVSNGQELNVTSDHPFMNDNGKVIASDLLVGQYLYDNDDEPIQIIKIEEVNETKASYDVETESGMFSFSGIRSSNCRTYNGYDANFDFSYIINNILKYDKAPSGYLYSGNQKDGRGNIAPATVILPTIAMKSKGRIGNKNIEDFFDDLTVKIEECRDSLVERFTLIASQSPASATFMYQNRTMLGYIPKQGIVSALKHGTLAVGQIGIAECLQILIGKDHTTPEGMALAKRIEKLFNDKCAEYKAQKYTILDQEMYLNFGVYFTPAESLCNTALKKFKDKYGVIPNVSDKEFFTNSIHIPVWYDITPFEKIDLESELTGYSNAGCITYVEIDTAASHNIKAMEQLVVYAMEHDIPYLGINLSLDTCRDCGWSGEIGNRCPACRSTNIQRLRRVTGYITESYLDAFNDGKIDETNHRVKHYGTIEKVKYVPSIENIHESHPELKKKYKTNAKPDITL